MPINVNTEAVKVIAGEIDSEYKRIRAMFDDINSCKENLKTDWTIDGQPTQSAQTVISSIEGLLVGQNAEINSQIEYLIEILYQAVGVDYETTEEANVRIARELSIARMNNETLIRNYTSSDPGFLKSGCYMASAANLYRRKLAYKNVDMDITIDTIMDANGTPRNSGLNYGFNIWNVKTNMKKSCHYTLINDGEPRSASRIKTILDVCPEGVFVAIPGKHAILIVGYEEVGGVTKYSVVDPCDGVIKPWEECWAYRNNIFGGKDIEVDLFNKAETVAYFDEKEE